MIAHNKAKSIDDLPVSDSGKGGEDGQSGVETVWYNYKRKGDIDYESNSKVYVTDIAGMHDFFVLRVKDMPAFRRWVDLFF